MSWSERTIGRALCTQFLQRKCIVLVPNTTWPGAECDVLAVTMDRRVIDVEIKISRADLKADAKKDKWWRYLSFAEGQQAGLVRDGRWDSREHRQPREWPRKVWKHYYAMPAEIWKPELLEALPSTRSGVLLLKWQPHGVLSVRCERRAIPDRNCERITPEQALDVARLANLRMWEAFNANEKRHVPAETVGGEL